MSDVSLIRVSKTYERSGTVVDDLTLRIQEGEFFTLLGPSGCGKTTTLRMIAGFEEPTGGTIAFGDRDVTALPPNKRNVGIVFQNYALFPHMPVGKNVEFGLRAQHTEKSRRSARVKAALAQVQLDDYGEARVDQMSGGQQQRVALARAIVTEPDLLLLDEPLSNLDAKLRDETRAMLRRLHSQTGHTLIYVTHDQSEALAMSTRIAVMSHGQVHQVGTPQEVYSTPASRFVAGFLGHNNVWDGTIVAAGSGACTVRLDAGATLNAQTLRHSPRLDVHEGARAGFSVRAEDVVLVPADDQRANVLSGAVSDIDYVGPRMELTLDSPIGIVRCEVPGTTRRPAFGERLRFELPAGAAYLLEDNGQPAGAADDQENR